MTALRSFSSAELLENHHSVNQSLQVGEPLDAGESLGAGSSKECSLGDLELESDSPTDLLAVEGPSEKHWPWARPQQSLLR